MGVSIIRNTHLPFIEIKTGTDSYYPVKKHSHRELSVGFIERGSSNISCRELNFKLKTFDLLLIPPETVHLCSPEDPDKFIFKVIYIDNHWLLESFGIEVKGLMPQKASTDQKEIALFGKFLNIFENSCDPLEVTSISVDFTETLLFDIFKNEPKKDVTTIDKDISKVREYIDENFSDDLKLEDLCNIADYDRFKLIRSFRTFFKLTPHSYLINKRIDYSKELLLKGVSVADTAQASGFFDQSHFTKTFRSYTGLNPKEYSKSLNS